MKKSETISKIAAALLSAQREIKFAAKDAKNPHFKNTYADLPAVIDAIKPALNKAGIAYLQTGSPSEHGHLHLTTCLMHESGEWLEDTLTMPLPKNDPQGYGSAMTYARRYALAAITGLYQDDDDGNAGCGLAQKAAAAPKPVAKPAAMSESELDDCCTALQECDDLDALKGIFGAAYKRADKGQQAVLKGAYDKKKSELSTMKEAA